LLAGRALFSQKGFDGTSTREIAAKSGCNMALISHYFGSKEGLLTAILQSEMRQGAPDFLAALRGAGSAADRLDRFIDLGIDHFADDGEFLRIAHRELIGSGRSSLAKLTIPMERVIQELTKQFEQLTPPGGQDLDARLTAVLLMGTMQYYFVSYPITSKLLGVESDSLKAALKQHITALFVRGFAANTLLPSHRATKNPAASGTKAPPKKRRAT
jgi:AcrR family transcriptional regulator